MSEEADEIEEEVVSEEEEVEDIWKLKRKKLKKKN
jgi:hypothetical protein